MTQDSQPLVAARFDTLVLATLDAEPILRIGPAPEYEVRLNPSLNLAQLASLGPNYLRVLRAVIDKALEEAES